MDTGQSPVVFQHDVTLKVQEQIIGRHDPTREEMPAHPVGLALGVERVGKSGVAKDVDHQLPRGFEPG